MRKPSASQHKTERFQQKHFFLLKFVVSVKSGGVLRHEVQSLCLLSVSDSLE